MTRADGLSSAKGRVQPRAACGGAPRLHGTPEPGRVGRTESHGCVRLTNWDAARVAALVKPGTSVEFR